ncbi:flagellar basal body-associated FliL family protein [Thermoleophilum album]|uniref:Flagellar protein FliL n=1 Tax=Thermoleophilum album TaxID=29539 RepID=A0A1H6G1U5_THEAL|nr:flagellar basal body-associated FliL family protein [Thermoleophilum album]SEH16253.1 flagellar FliL protein [Thermoleophilum album]
MKKRVVITVALVAALGGGAYKFALAKPAEPEHKVDGFGYVLPREFVVNLDGDRFAKVSVSLLLLEDTVFPEEEGKPPEGFGPLEQEALVRDIVTDVITGTPASSLIRRSGRRRLKKRIVKRLRAETDVLVEDVLLMDVTVQ